MTMPHDVIRRNAGCKNQEDRIRNSESKNKRNKELLSLITGNSNPDPQMIFYSMTSLCMFCAKIF